MPKSNVASKVTVLPAPHGLDLPYAAEYVEIAGLLLEDDAASFVLEVVDLGPAQGTVAEVDLPIAGRGSVVGAWTHNDRTHFVDQLGVGVEMPDRVIGFVGVHGV